MDPAPCALETLRPDETCPICRHSEPRPQDDWERARRRTDVEEPQPLILVA